MSAAVATVDPKEIYRICAEWDTASDANRLLAKEFVGRFIRYPFKMACIASREEDVEECPVPFVEIYIQSDARKRVTDWLEIQATGAMGVVFDEYKDPEKPEVGRLSDACDEFNEATGVEFVEHAGSDSEMEVDDLE
jgi:hypothetical protein